MQKHLLIVSHRFFPRYRAGTEVLGLQLARGLQARGYRVTVLTGEPDENSPCNVTPWVSSDTYEDLAVYRLHYGTAEQSWGKYGARQKLIVALRMLNGGFDPVSSHLNAPKQLAVARELMERLKPDLIHFNHIIGYSAAIIPEMRRLGIPVVFTPTDYFVVCPKDQLYRKFDHRTCDGPGNAVDCVRCMQAMPRWTAEFAMRAGQYAPGTLFRSIAQRASGMVRAVNAANKILPSTRFLSDVLTRHGVDNTLIKVVPYGIDIGELPPLRPIPARFDERSPLQLGFIGALVETKGAHIVVDALSYLGARKKEIFLNIFGKIDASDQYCLSLQESAEKFENSVRFAGTFPPEKIGEILRRLDVLVVPSLWYESMPLVLRSALNAGTPVMVSRMGGLTEPLTDAHDQSFPAGDARSLAQLILRLLDKPRLLNDMRERQANGARTLADYLNDVEAEYQTILDQN